MLCRGKDSSSCRRPTPPESFASPASPAGRVGKAANSGWGAFCVVAAARPPAAPWSAATVRIEHENMSSVIIGVFSSYLGSWFLCFLQIMNNDNYIS